MLEEVKLLAGAGAEERERPSKSDSRLLAGLVTAAVTGGGLGLLSPGTKTGESLSTPQ